jgi:arsenate reductase-like glutaredoxin family protein
MTLVMAGEGIRFLSSLHKTKLAMKPSFNFHDLYLLFNPETELGKKTLAVAQSVNRYIHEVNVLEKTVTPLYWKEVSTRLGLEPIDLIHAGHPTYASLFAGRQYAEQDVLEILFHHPELVRGPIGLHRDRAVLCDDPKDILKLDLTPAAEKDTYQG